jgi:hypothetical protein
MARLRPAGSSEIVLAAPISASTPRSLIDEGDRFVVEQEMRSGTDPAGPRELLEGFFDFNYRHRADLILVVAEISTLAELGLIDSMLAWRERLVKLVFGARPTLAQSTRGVIAFGGLQDCCLQFPDPSYEDLRDATVTGALAALGI